MGAAVRQESTCASRSSRETMRACSAPTSVFSADMGVRFPVALCAATTLPTRLQHGNRAPDHGVWNALLWLRSRVALVRGKAVAFITVLIVCDGFFHTTMYVLRSE